MYDFAVLPIRIILDSDDSVTVHLRDTQTVRTVRSEAILDVNHAGRWIRGIELVGGVDFNLSRAVMPFKPRRPLLSKSEGVTYDEEANAAFIYISMKSPVAGSLDAVPNIPIQLCRMRNLRSMAPRKSVPASGPNRLSHDEGAALALMHVRPSIPHTQRRRSYQTDTQHLAC